MVALSFYSPRAVRKVVKMSKAKLFRNINHSEVIVEGVDWEDEQLYYEDEVVTTEYPSSTPLKYERLIEESPIPAAIRHSEADLARTKQNNSPMKDGRVSNWFWKLYEKTLKAFFDSVLGKYGPK
jgi:hypothetical protein